MKPPKSTLITKQKHLRPQSLKNKIIKNQLFPTQVTHQEVNQARQLDQTLKNPDGTIKIMHTESLQKKPPILLKIWITTNKLYHYPTEESLDWLYNKTSRYIDNKTCIEICSGVGLISRELDLPAYDNMNHLSAAKKNIHGRNKSVQSQANINYPEWTIKMSSNEAVNILKPKCVIGSYITQIL